jgi:hypothetical protein
MKAVRIREYGATDVLRYEESTTGLTGQIDFSAGSTLEPL